MAKHVVKPDHTGMLDRTKAKPGMLEAQLTKFNPYHDSKSGKFTNANAGVSAQSLNDFFSDSSAVYSGLKLGSNKVNLSEEDLKSNMALVKALLGKTKVGKLDTVSFETLDQDCLAQCSLRWTKDNPSTTDFVIVLRMDPTKESLAGKMWSEDQTAIAQKKIPWSATAYGKRTDVKRNLVTHELGHAAMGEHTVTKVAQDEWVDSNNPMKGDKKWKETIHEAAQAGWQPPSEYAKQDYAEMFSECYTKMEITGTTGDKGVDNYVKDVITNG